MRHALKNNSVLFSAKQQREITTLGSLRSTTRRQRLKTSFKIVSSSLSTFFVTISVSSTFESQRDYPETEFRGVVSKLGKKIPNRACVFTFFVKLEKWSFHFAGRAKLLFLLIKYANRKFVVLATTWANKTKS